MAIQGFHHLAIQVTQVEALVTFYRQVLGLTEQARYVRPDGTLRSVWMAIPGGGFLALESCEGPLVPDPFRAPTPGLHLLAFRLFRNDRERWMSHLAAHGVEIVHQTRFSFYIRDPEGNRLAFSHHPEDAQPVEQST
jgi:glyoxylase I family protein